MAVIACSVGAIRRIAQRLIPAEKIRYQCLSERFEDEDGTATQESEAAYSYTLQRLLVLLLSVIGSIDSLVLAVIATRDTNFIANAEQWLHFGAWVVVKHILSQVKC